MKQVYTILENIRNAKPLCIVGGPYTGKSALINLAITIILDY
jgi:hypothetical protein